jgi:GTP cyclohydrolase I
MTLEAIRPGGPNLTDDARAALREVLLVIGENPDREGLDATTDSIIRAWTELLQGYGEDPTALFTTGIEEVERCNEVVLLKDVFFRSTCERHLMPFSGTALVAYIPENRAVGLSVLGRLVDCFARRLQEPSRMANQIAEVLARNMGTRGCGVLIRTEQGCRACLAGDSSARTIVFAVEGNFCEPAARRAFMGYLDGEWRDVPGQ